jgi:hypothetical protein
VNQDTGNIGSRGGACGPQPSITLHSKLERLVSTKWSFDLLYRQRLVAAFSSPSTTVPRLDPQSHSYSESSLIILRTRFDGPFWHHSHVRRYQLNVWRIGSRQSAGYRVLVSAVLPDVRGLCIWYHTFVHEALYAGAIIFSSRRQRSVNMS